MDFLIRNETRIIGLLESILFAAGEPVVVAEISAALNIPADQLENSIDSLEKLLECEDRGIRLVRTGNSISLATKTENYPQIAAVLGRSRKRTLTRAASEVLAVIAYRQPVTRVDIDQIRGVGSAGSLQRLLDAGLIEECGRLEAPGRPWLYRTTDVFLRTAGIERLEDLPEWKDFCVPEEDNTGSDQEEN
ncbi:MAG: SMC-Scp complex subunit ScpB [Eubacteriaceae bacterium]|jgi:segregation and condensation protein B